MEHDVPLKQMAESMEVSSAHLSAMEYGDKKLNENHIEAALKFFAVIGASKQELDELRDAGGQSIESVSTKEMPSDARAMVYAFARKLQENGKPPTAVVNWVKDRK